jgi:hypothetical protein
MAQFELGISIEGDAALDNRLRSAGYRALNAEPALREVLTVLHESEESLWQRKPWPQNATATLENKSSTEPLIRTGALERSLTSLGDDNAIAMITASTLKFGTKLWYAHFALGTTTEPKRQLFKVRAVDKREIQSIVGAFIANGVTRIV